MKFLATLILVVLFQATGISQTNKTFFLGHSLVNFHMPNMVNKLSIAAEENFQYEANIGIGANLLMHWTNPGSGQGSPWNITLNQGGFENFVITEAVPLKGHLQWSQTYRCADSLYQFAEQYNPGIQYYIYETWHCISSGTPTGCEWDNDDHIAWRDRLSLDLPLWEGIADSINLLHEKEMLIIPAGQALARLYDSIEVGHVPGISSMNQLFTDDIHLSYTGNYFIACVMFAVLQGKSPEGLPNRLTDEWGTPYNDYPTPELALKFQQIAWETIKAYPRDGVDGIQLGINTITVTSKINTRDQVEINWQVKDEGTSAYFMVEKSEDCKTFTPISDKIWKNDKHTYSFTDAQASAESSYYRIKIISYSNDIRYSKIIQVQNALSRQITMAPTAVSGDLYLTIASSFKELNIKILNINGIVEFQKRIRHIQKGHFETLDVSKLQKGIYLLNITDDVSNKYSGKFVKAE